MADRKVFVTRRMPQEALDLLQRESDLKVWGDEMPPPYEALKEEAREAAGLVTTVEDRIDRELMDAAPGLRVISQVAVGFDNIDVAEATSRGIPVGHTPGVLSRTTAEFAFALMLAMARRVVESDKYTREGKWRCWLPMGFLGRDLHQATLGIVGLGKIGLEIAKRALGFEMHILYSDAVRRREEEERYGLEYAPDLPSLLGDSDFVTLHVPLMPATYHLIGEKELAMMKPTAILVNSSRGPVVDLRALYRALRGKVIAGAAVDVTEPEPIDPKDPILGLDNLVITPHIGSASVVTRTRMAMMAAENLLAGLRGEPLPHCVNAEGLKG